MLWRETYSWAHCCVRDIKSLRQLDRRNSRRGNFPFSISEQMKEEGKIDFFPAQHWTKCLLVWASYPSRSFTQVDASGLLHFWASASMSSNYTKRVCQTESRFKKSARLAWEFRSWVESFYRSEGKNSLKTRRETFSGSLECVRVGEKFWHFPSIHFYVCVTEENSSRFSNENMKNKSWERSKVVSFAKIVMSRSGLMAEVEQHLLWEFIIFPKSSKLLRRLLENSITPTQPCFLNQTFGALTHLQPTTQTPTSKREGEEQQIEWDFHVSWRFRHDTEDERDRRLQSVNGSEKSLRKLPRWAS